jgi:hypothetical protein
MGFRRFSILMLAAATVLSAVGQCQQDLHQDLHQGRFVIGNPGRASARTSVQLPAHIHSLGDAADFVNHTLRSSGYLEQAWFLYERNGEDIPGIPGFAVFTKLEQIDDSGKPLPNGRRYSLDVQSPAIHGIGDYVRALLSPAPSGHYRAIAIYVFDPHIEPARKGSAPQSFEQQDAMFVAGARQPLSQIYNAPSSGNAAEQPNANVYIYEYVKRNAEDTAQPVAHSALNVQQHLKNAGLEVLLTGDSLHHE